jgi:hypothetical protein
MAYIWFCLIETQLAYTGSFTYKVETMPELISTHWADGVHQQKAHTQMTEKTEEVSRKGDVLHICIDMEGFL